MKKHIKAAAMIFAAALALSGCTHSGKKALSIKDKDIRLAIDEKYTVKTEGGKGETIKWSSNDETIAIVGPDGTITAVGNGITTVTAETSSEYAHVGVIVGRDDEYIDSDGNEVQNFNGSSEITKIEVGVKSGGKNDISIKKDDKYTLVVYTTPSGANDKIVWKSSDKKIVTVSDTGEIEAVGVGKATVRAYAPNGVYGELLVRVR